MKVCIPSLQDEKLKSKICDHFGSAPIFIIADTGSKETKAIENSNQHHSHGNCHPLSVLSGNDFQALVVRGIGQGAVQNLRATGIEVYKTSAETVEDAINEINSGSLKPVSIDSVCGHYGQGKGCQ